MAKTNPEVAVIATFDSAAQANQAANDLMDWEQTNPNINLGPISVLTKNKKGDLKTRSYGARNTRKGAKIGAGIGVAAAIVSGGLTLIPTAIGGAVAGAAAGSMSRKQIHLTQAELAELNASLDGGRAAITVMCRPAESQAIADYLNLEGGRTMSRPVEPVDLKSAAGGPPGPQQ